MNINLIGAYNVYNIYLEFSAVAVTFVCRNNVVPTFNFDREAALDTEHRP